MWNESETNAIAAVSPHTEQSSMTPYETAYQYRLVQSHEYPVDHRSREQIILEEALYYFNCCTFDRFFDEIKNVHNVPLSAVIRLNKGTESIDELRQVLTSNGHQIVDDIVVIPQPIYESSSSDDFDDTEASTQVQQTNDCVSDEEW